MSIRLNCVKEFSFPEWQPEHRKTLFQNSPRRNSCWYCTNSHNLTKAYYFLRTFSLLPPSQSGGLSSAASLQQHQLCWHNCRVHATPFNLSRFHKTRRQFRRHILTSCGLFQFHSMKISVAKLVFSVCFCWKWCAQVRSHGCYRTVDRGVPVCSMCAHF